MSSDQDGEIVELRRRLRELEQKHAVEQAKRLRIEAAQQDEEGRKQLAEALTSAGVSGSAARVALNHLRFEGLVKTTEDGELVFVKQRSGGRGEEVELSDGLAAWLKSDEGRMFLEPSGGGESGTRSRRDTGGGNDERMTSRQRAGEALRRWRG